MILGRWNFGARMTDAAHPEWLPPPPEPKPHLLQRAQPTDREQEWADFGDCLSAIYGWIRDEERWAAIEDRIDQQVRLNHD